MISTMVNVAIPMIQHVKYAQPTIYVLTMAVNTAGLVRKDYLRESTNYLVTTPRVAVKELQLRNQRNGLTKLK